MLPSHTVRCLENRALTPGVRELLFTKPPGFSFRAGQFVMFSVPLVEDAGNLQVRAFSIASAPSEPDLRFAMKIVANGRASRWMEEILTEGQPATMQGPLGAFTLDRTTTKPYVFLATGTGIAPIRAQIAWALREEDDTRPMDLFFGVRGQQDLFWVEELKQWEKTYSNFRAHLCISSGEPDWHGHHGRITQLAPLVVPALPACSLYLCGSPEAVKEIRKTAMEEWKVPKEDVHAEEFI